MLHIHFFLLKSMSIHIQRFPGNILPSTYSSKVKGVIRRSELERRIEYISFLKVCYGSIHPRLVNLITKCLDNDPSKRPKTDWLLAMLQDTKADLKDLITDRLDMSKVRLVKANKIKDRRIDELVQQQVCISCYV